MRSESEMNIIRMAEEAGFGANQRATLRLKLQRFAALVAVAEREVCADVCAGHYDTAQAAAAIRARGEK